MRYCDNDDGHLVAYRSRVVVVVVVSHIQRLVANPKKTTLHGGQSRSWSAEQGKKEKEKVWQRTLCCECECVSCSWGVARYSRERSCLVAFRDRHRDNGDATSDSITGSYVLMYVLVTGVRLGVLL